MPLPHQRHSVHRICILVFVSLCFLLAGLSTIRSQAQNTITVNPTPVANYLTNPGIGWHQKNLELPQMLPETTTYLSRPNIAWDVLNPGEDVYNWGVIDGAIVAAEAQDKQIAFRIYTMGPEPVHRVPSWVLANGAVITADSFPDYNNCTYQREWSKFVEALRQRYDGHPAIAYIDISGYGNYNEWNWIDTANWTSLESDYNNPVTLDGHARRRLADAFIGGAQSSSLCVDSLGVQQSVSYNYVGFQETQLVMPYAGIRQSTEYVYDRRPDVGFRHDCLGSPTHNVWSALSTTLDDLWKTAPVVFEFCTGTSTDEPYVTLANILLRQSHATMVGDSFDVQGNRNPVVTESFMSQVGYRYQLRSATYPAVVTVGQNFTVDMNWWNVGYAPAYPKMGHDFTAYFYLVDAQGQTVAAFPLQSAIENWMPADDVTATSTQNPPDNRTADTWTMPVLPPGIYSTYVGIVHNPSGNHINLAIGGRDREGRYLLNQITVQSDLPTSTSTHTSTVIPTATATPIPTNTPPHVPSTTPVAVNTDTPVPVHTQLIQPDILSKTPAPDNTHTVLNNALIIAAQISQTPQFNGLDIFVHKTGSPASVQIGETVTFTITVTNPNTQALADVTITDNVPAVFAITGVTTSHGTATINDNRVTVNIGTVQSQQTITIYINTRSIAIGFAPDTCNSVLVGGGISNQACPNIFPSVLPQTGQSPFGAIRTILIGLTIVISLAFLLLYTIKRTNSATK
jgi:fimbrial isopeptide formation D2 family protein